MTSLPDPRQTRETRCFSVCARLVPLSVPASRERRNVCRPMVGLAETTPTACPRRWRYRTRGQCPALSTKYASTRPFSDPIQPLKPIRLGIPNLVTRSPPMRGDHQSAPVIRRTDTMAPRAPPMRPRLAQYARQLIPTIRATSSALTGAGCLTSNASMARAALAASERSILRRSRASAASSSLSVC